MYERVTFAMGRWAATLAAAVATAATTTAAVVACGPPPRPAVEDAGGGLMDSGGSHDAGRDEQCAKLDVLFVIDNSGSMDQEQANLIDNFPAFIEVLDRSGLDYRVAVTTTGRDYEYALFIPPIGTFPMSIDGGHNGTLLRPARCHMPRRWIAKGDPDPSGTFSCLANVGTDGPSDEMPLSAMRDAFEERVADGTNAGFRRSDALLGVVFLTDEEDCSYEHPVTLTFGELLCVSMREPVEHYVDFLDELTGHRSRWAIAAIAGPGPGTCSSAFGSADEAKRLKQLVQLTGANGTLSSICSGDLSVGLTQALEIFESACGGIIL